MWDRGGAPHVCRAKEQGPAMATDRPEQKRRDFFTERALYQHRDTSTYLRFMRLNIVGVTWIFGAGAVILVPGKYFRHRPNLLSSQMTIFVIIHLAKTAVVSRNIWQFFTSRRFAPPSRPGLLRPRAFAPSTPRYASVKTIKLFEKSSVRWHTNMKCLNVWPKNWCIVYCTQPG